MWSCSCTEMPVAQLWPRWMHVQWHVHREGMLSHHCRCPCPSKEPDSLDQSFQRAQQPGRSSFLCFYTEQCSEKRSCSPLAGCGSTADHWHRQVWMSLSSELPVCHCAPVGAAGAQCGASWQDSAGRFWRAQTLCPVGASPSVDHPCSEVSGSRGQGWGRTCRRGSVAKMYHQRAPAVLPCPAAPSHYGNTLWPCAGVYVHALTHTCPLFFLTFWTVERLKQTALQQAAQQSTAFQYIPFLRGVSSEQQTACGIPSPCVSPPASPSFAAHTWTTSPRGGCPAPR